VAERHDRFEEELGGGNMEITFKVTEACFVEHSTKTTKNIDNEGGTKYRANEVDRLLPFIILQRL
jgi:hypothetical protein